MNDVRSSLRIARVEDEPALLGLMRDFYVEEHLVFDELITPRALHDLLLNADTGFVLLLENIPAALGYAVVTYGYSLEFHGRYALLDELYLAPTARGQGLSRILTAEIEKQVRARNIQALRLEVNRGNTRALSLYLKAGFTDHHRDLLTRWLN